MAKSHAVSSAIAGLSVLVLLLVAGLGYAVVNRPTTGSSSGNSGVTSTITQTSVQLSIGTTTAVSTATAASTTTVTVAQSLEALAKAEGGALTVYTISNPDSYNRFLLPNILKSYPWLKISPVFLDPAGTITRPTAELQAGHVVADVLDIGNMGRTLTDVANGDCASVDLSNILALNGYPASASDPQGRWFATQGSLNVMFYNTNLLSPSQAPKSYQDLGNPIYKGKIALDKPQLLGSTGTILASLYALLGNASWTKLVQNIVANNIALQSSGGTVETLVTQGQYAIGVDTLTGVISSINKGLPVKVVWTNPVEASNSAQCVATQAPHPYTALLYIYWELNTVGQVAIGAAGRTSNLNQITSWTFTGVIPSNVTLASDVLKTDFITNPNFWTNVFNGFFGQ